MLIQEIQGDTAEHRALHALAQALNERLESLENPYRTMLPRVEPAGDGNRPIAAGLEMLRDAMQTCGRDMTLMQLWKQVGVELAFKVSYPQAVQTK